MIITSLLRFVNAYCALPRKTLLDKSRFRKEMDMLGQITARDNLILVLQKDCYCSYHAYDIAEVREMRPRKYHVTLTEDEHKYLNEMTRRGTASAQKIKHAQVLLKLDETYNDKPWQLEEIRKAYGVSIGTICSIAQRFVEEGLEFALNRKQQQNRHHKITGEVEAHIVAIACSY